MQSGRIWATSAAASVTLAAMLSVWCAVSDGYADEKFNTQKYVNLVFGGAELVDCEAQHEVPTENCELNTELIVFMSSKLYWTHNGYLQKDGSFPGMPDYPEKLKGVLESEKRNKESIEYFFRNEAAVFGACLLDGCGDILRLPHRNTKPAHITCEFGDSYRILISINAAVGGYLFNTGTYLKKLSSLFNPLHEFRIFLRHNSSPTLQSSPIILPVLSNGKTSRDVLKWGKAGASVLRVT
jgi:hypothetical protein